MTATRILLAIALMMFAASTAFALHINEIRIDHGGSDIDEYFELAGPPGTSLDGLFYVVIGDLSSAPRCGGVETVIDLTGASIQADGLLVVGNSNTSGHMFTYDMLADLHFENGDNVTHMLVENFAGAVGDDVDTDNDCVLDNPPVILDSVGLWEGTVVDCMGTDECLYSSTVVGPDGNFVPGHVHLCPEGWLIGGFTLGTDDTPGDANNCPVPVEPSTWGGVKSIYRD